MGLIVFSCQSEMKCSSMCDTLMNSKVNSSLLVDMFKNKKFTIKKKSCISLTQITKSTYFQKFYLLHGCIR